MNRQTDFELLCHVEDGNIDAIKRKLGEGADPNARKHEGHTALMLAAYRGYADIVQILLGAGADSKAENSSGALDIMVPDSPQKDFRRERFPTALSYAKRGQIKSPLAGVKEELVDYEKTIELLTKSMKA